MEQGETALGGRVARVVLVEVDEVATSMSTTRGIPPTLVGYRTPRISLEVLRLMGRGILSTDMAGIRILGATGLLQGMACEFKSVPCLKND